MACVFMACMDGQILQGVLEATCMHCSWLGDALAIPAYVVQFHFMSTFIACTGVSPLLQQACMVFQAQYLIIAGLEWGRS